MMNDRHVCKAFTAACRIEASGDCANIRGLHPIANTTLVRNPILRTDLGDALAVHAIFDRQDASRSRNESR